MKLDMSELIKSGWALMEIQRPAMEQNADIELSWLLFGADGEIDVIISPQPEAANSIPAKRAMMVEVKKRCAAIRAYAVFAVSDSFVGGYKTKDGQPLTDADRRLLEWIERVGSEEAERLGVIPPRREAIIVQVNTPLSSALLIQYYRREITADKTLIIWEETEEQSADVPPEMNLRGHLSGYFDYMNESEGRS